MKILEVKMHRIRSRIGSAGFTLIELGLVLVIMSLLAAGVLTILTQKTRIANQEELKMKLDAIENALIGYRKGHNNLPCPADITVNDDTTQNFGIPAVDPGSCDDGDGSPGSPAAILDTKSVYGMVPVRALGLPDEYAYDPWGGRLKYAVDITATEANAFNVYGPSDTTVGEIAIYDQGGTLRTGSAVAAVISQGPNGHGAYLYNGVRKFVDSVNGAEHQNCACAAVEGGFAFLAPDAFYMYGFTSSPTDPLNQFDDTVRYYTRAQLSATADTITESP